MRSRSVRATRAAGVVALAFTLALAVGALAPTAARAASAVGCGGACSLTETLGRPQLLGHVDAILPVTVTCNPLAGAAFTNTFVNVSLQQVVGRISTSGFNFFNNNFLCNGSPQTIALFVAPLSSGGGGTLRFHSGPAVGLVDVDVEFFDAFGNFIGSVFVGDGPRTVRIAG